MSRNEMAFPFCAIPADRLIALATATAFRDNFLVTDGRMPIVSKRQATSLAALSPEKSQRSI